MFILEDIIHELMHLNLDAKRDVKWVSDGKNYCSWEEFAQQASQIDDGAVNPQLVVVVTGGWLQQMEEGIWQFISPPERPQNEGPLQLLES